MLPQRPLPPAEGPDPDADRAAAERRFRSLTDALSQVIMTSDAHRRLNYANKHYVAYTGIASADLATRWREAIHPDDLAAIDSSRARGSQYEVEYRLRRTDGVYRWHVATTYTIPPETGLEGWLAVAIDIDDRKRAEESLRYIEHAGAQLAQSLDLATTFNVILDLVVPELADWAAITLRDDDGRVRTAAARHRDPAKAYLTAALVGADYFRDGYTGGTLATYQTGEVVVRSNLKRDFLIDAIAEPFVPIVEALGCESMLALPIFAGDDVIGSLTLVGADSDQRFASPDLRGLEELARRTSFAIANARRFEREARVARTLQDAALPQTLPSVAGIHFDSYYRAGRSESLIGGDWYDAIVTADGSIVVSVGDVAGSGLAAAVRMNMMRHVLRAAAQVNTEPTAMLDLADRLLRGEDRDAMVTAFVAVIAADRRTIRYASAGHVPALLRDASGAIAELGTAGPPLGCGDFAHAQTHEAVLTPGSCLLLYTDGLIEWSRDVIEGDEHLQRSFATLAVDAVDHPAQALVERVLATRFARDDIAALTVRFSG